MESTMEQIRTRLQKGERPQDLIKKGFKRTTVYSVAKKLEGQPEENNNDKSRDRDIFLACIMKEMMGWILSEDLNFDLDGHEETERWESIKKIARDQFEQLLGRKPPEDFLVSTLRSRDYSI